MIVGYDKTGQKLDWGDICKFTIEKKEYEGMIDYDEDVFAYVFDMKDDKFPCVLMSKVDLDSIERIINIWSTQPDKDNYDFYRDIARSK
jgi:hypothetical protein